MSGGIMEDIRAAAEIAAPTVETTSGAVPLEGAEARPLEADTAAAQRARDEAGRFAAKAPEASKAKERTPEAATKPAESAPKEQAQAEEKKPEAAPTARKPPASWRAAAKEKWASLPPEVQEDALRVDSEVQRVFRESAQARRLADGLEKTLAPYRPLLGQADPLAVTSNLLQTMATLQQGTPQQKAGLVAHMIRNFSVGLEDIDAALQGQAAAPAPQVQRQAPAEFRDPRLDDMLARHEESTRREHAQKVQAFEAQAEFINEPVPGRNNQDGSPSLVRDVMADLIDAKVVSTLEDAYDLAIAKHPEVQRVLAGRKPATPAVTATPQAATQRARNAASSVKHEPTSTAPSKGKGSILDDVRAAAARQRGTR